MPGMSETTTTSNHSSTPLMSVEDVSVYLGVPVQTLYAWRSRGRGPASLRVGRHLRYRRVDLDAWVEQAMKEQR
jgi:excisionase family DNA binding protein